MRITPDTNVLVRIVVLDDPRQAEAAIEIIERADVIALPTITLCELVWVLEAFYEMRRADVIEAVEGFVSRSNVEVDRAAVEFGLRVYADGAGFADGIVAYEGARLGGSMFVSFDRKAVRTLLRCQRDAQLLGPSLS